MKYIKNSKVHETQTNTRKYSNTKSPLPPTQILPRNKKHTQNFTPIPKIYFLNLKFYSNPESIPKTNVFKPDPNTELNDLPGSWVTGSTAGEPRVNK